MTEIAIIVPTIGRPERLGGLAAKFRMTSPPHRMVFVCDRDDQPSITEVMAGEYATFPFVARWYITRHGPLYDQAFRHNGADIDASLRARQRGAFAYAPDAVVEHVHPNYGKADVDDTYLHGGLDPAKNKADDLLLWGRWRLELEAMGRSLDAAA
jgi:GT2 family glycosyltransferase